MGISRNNCFKWKCFGYQSHTGNKFLSSEYKKHSDFVNLFLKSASHMPENMVILEALTSKLYIVIVRNCAYKDPTDNPLAMNREETVSVVYPRSKVLLHYWYELLLSHCHMSTMALVGCLPLHYHLGYFKSSSIKLSILYVFFFSLDHKHLVIMQSKCSF